MADKGKKQEEQQKALQRRIAKGRIQDLVEKMKEVESQKARLEIISDSLEDLKKKEEGSVLIPTGAGIYLKGELKDTENVLVEVGSGVVKPKSFEEAKKFLEKRSEELEERSDELKEEIVNIKKGLTSQ